VLGLLSFLVVALFLTSCGSIRIRSFLRDEKVVIASDVREKIVGKTPLAVSLSKLNQGETQLIPLMVRKKDFKDTLFLFLVSLGSYFLLDVILEKQTTVIEAAEQPLQLNLKSSLQAEALVGFTTDKIDQGRRKIPQTFQLSDIASKRMLLRDSSGQSAFLNLSHLRREFFILKSSLLLLQYIIYRR